MSGHQYMCIAKKKYEEDQEYYSRLLTAITLLLNSDYRLVIRQEEDKIIVIEYCAEDESFGDEMPMWLTPSEIERIELERTEDKNGKEDS